MSTLSNVTPERGKHLSPHIGLTANVSSRISKDGVSVRSAQAVLEAQAPPLERYAPSPGKKWFVLRATYHRETKAYHYLINKGIECYLPLHRTLKCIRGKRKFITESYLPNLLFVYETPQKVEDVIKNTPELHFLNYYYDHFCNMEDGKNPPLTVPYDAMMNFIKVASIDNPHVKLVQPNHCHYKSGDIVKVIDGEFKGVEGRVARVSGQQRVVVEIEGVCLITTAYIPSAFIEKKD